MNDIPKILQKNPQFLPNLENMIRNLIIISEFVIVLKLKKIAFDFFSILIKILNYLLKLKIEQNLKSWCIMLLKNILNHIHFEYGRIQMNISDSIKIITIIIDDLISTDLKDLDTISFLSSIRKIYIIF